MRLLLSITRVLLRAYPAGWRERWRGECLGTFQQGCDNVRVVRGRTALLRHVVAEWCDMLRTAVRLRRARSASGRARSPGRRGRAFGSDLRLAIRSLRATPTHTAIALFTLALGIGANAGLFSVLDSLLFRPVPFTDAHRLVELLNLSEESNVQFPGFNRALLTLWREQTDLFDRVEAYDDDFAVFDGAQGAEVVDMAIVTPGVFTMLGVAPHTGRTFVDGDGRDGSDALIIVSERVWRSRFGARADLVGASLAVNGRTHTVIGIMPASFHFPYRSTEMWVPRDIGAPAPGVAASATMYALPRLAVGVPFDRAITEVTSRGARLHRAATGDTGVSAIILPRDRLDVRRKRMLQVLGASVAFLLLIVCANMANLSLSKALARNRDAAVRSALGASRWDLIREAFVEQMLLGVVGAAAGLLIASAIVALANDALPDTLTVESLNPIDLDGRTLLLALVAGLVTPVVFGLPTALITSGKHVVAGLSQHSRSTTGSRRAHRWRNSLVIIEVSLAMVLLVGAALMGRSLYSLITIDRGFNSEGLVALRVGLPTSTYADPSTRDRFSDAVVAELQQHPGLTDVTVGSVPPNPSGANFGALEFADRPSATTDRFVVHTYRVWPDYFERIGLRLLEGRPFTQDESQSSIIVSESFATHHWPAGSAVGRQFRFTGSAAWRTVVGVSTEVRQLGLDDAQGSFEWFVPLRTPSGAAAARRSASAIIIEHRTFVARADNEAVALDTLKRAVHRVDPSVVIWTAGSVDASFAKAVAQPRLVLIVLGALGGLGLVLAAAGLYGVLSHLVTVRLREFGIRLALGARPHMVFRLILRQGAWLTGVGVATGTVAAMLLVQTMQSFLFDVEASDPAALVVVAAVLVLSALAACWRPARRAMRVDPVSLLREQ